MAGNSATTSNASVNAIADPSQQVNTLNNKYPNLALTTYLTTGAIQAADTLMLTVPNQLGVEYNAHAIESILRFVAPELGWR